jgi:hypothetical protein
MATLLLQAADAAIGGIANAATSLAGNALRAAISGSGGKGTSVRHVEGPRLAEMGGLASTEGAPIPRIYGRARIGGELIWATRFEEVATTTTNVERQASRGGKSFGSSGKATTKTTTTTSYAYYANLAVGLCEGPISFVRRVWADGTELDLTTLTMRVHRGGETQEPDSLIVAKEGAENAPAYRGLAYVVFEHLPLAGFGNRVPQFSFEVVRAVDGLAQMIRHVCLIPGSTEFGYDTLPVTRILGLGASAPENIQQLQRSADVTASLDWLQALCPNLTGVSLVVGWFGDDIRAGACTITPRVDVNDKATSGSIWSVAGLTRATARPVSQVAGRPAYGGTPSDESVIRLIGELKARGLAVTFYPFVLMDIPAGNTLPDPATGAAGQKPYPWRGRITCDPAPGAPGTVDGTVAAAGQVAAFFGNAAPAHFSMAGGAVSYAGPPDWGFRRHILHCAHLAKMAGVDAFIIGSEMVGLTRVRSASGAYPAVGALQALASDVKGVLGPATVTYAADWTEYGAHVLGGGTEVRFPLDPLWSDPAIGAVAIDYYPPISDWRDGPDHADLAEASGPADRDYLRRRLGSGEAFDWYYASPADRLAQTRTPITDGAYGKPWIYRAKDLVAWWSNAHVERAAGQEVAATGWVPGSKPIWLSELGVPAVDKGANGPNVFPDPKSSESAFPPFSRGHRDDLVQARALEAILSRFDPALPGHVAAWNPAASAYPGRMVDPARMSVWCWDARPFPAFPDFDLVWADGPNWQTGHWITGRLEGAPLDRLVAAILADFGLGDGTPIPLGGHVDGFVDGYVIDRPMSARDALEPLATLFGFDVIARPGGLGWRGRGGSVEVVLTRDDLVDAEKEPLLSRSRAQETDLPAALEIGFTDAEGEYARAAIGSRRLAGTSRRELRADVAVVTRRADVQRLADIQLQDLWAGRESVEFGLSPREVALEPGDVVRLATPSSAGLYRVTRIADGRVRRIEARAVEPAVFAAPPGAVPPRRRTPPSVAGPPEAILLTLAAAPSEPAPLQYLAVAADPWPGAMAVWRSEDGAGFTLARILDLPAVIGRTLTAMPAGPLWRWDRVAVLDVKLSDDAAASIDDAAALAGGNLFALEGPDGLWEILTAARADLIGHRTYRLSRFLRGLAGSEDGAARPVPAGARIVRLDEAVVGLTSSLADLGRSPIYRVGPASRDHADPSYVELSAPVAGDALKPLRPVHVRARRTGAGIDIAWTRRTRIEGDGWEALEVPLGEESERYELDILKNDAVQRTLAATVPRALYSADLELADFGTAQSTLRVRVAQLGAAIGRGFAAEATVAILPS